MNTLNIIGHKIELQKCTKSQLKGLTVGESLSYSFYYGVFRDIPLLFLQPKQEFFVGGAPSPRICSLTSMRISSLQDRPVVFILEPCPTYERQRLIDKGVYFVIGERYAHLPMIIANECVRNKATAKRLTPVGQYILLYHLQIENIEGLTAREMAGMLPYSYESITLGLTCLSELHLCEKVRRDNRSKSVHFKFKGAELWEKSQPYLINPIEKTIYCDELKSEYAYPVCGINALSHYSRLNPESERIIMMESRQLRQHKKEGKLVNENQFDGNVVIEVWKYPPVSLRNNVPVWVDKLSLVLSLKEDHDARVEGEVEHIINEMKWLD